ncbi:hypothetical protein [Trichormus sp. NMC-1]|uniref:hypothetical protein n=1 Tax=Trichormus sp. NMC-1 TaxID=1853259 RepID=UPI000B09F28F|nr:hypothetical protein [Trichormus sp. NMC-1]
MKSLTRRSWDTGTRGRRDTETRRHGDAGKIKNYLSPVTCSLFPVTCHLSPVTCHLSSVTCSLFPDYELRITNYELRIT